MELSQEQQIAFDKYVQGHNIFITGPGGAGKSALIKKINQHAFSRFKDIHVCALTGCAAVLLNCKAKTIHSWSGIGLGNGTIDYHINKIKCNKFAKVLWKGTDVLVIDEVSMLSLKLFTLLNAIGQTIRKNLKPFGGIQLIFSGDFYQLPPVGNRDDPDSMRFCFESPEWNHVFTRDCQIQLVKIFRQTDEIYSTILNQIRIGKLKKKHHDILLQYVDRPRDPNLVVEPTKLFPTKSKVENINSTKIRSIALPEKMYELKYLSDVKLTKMEADTFTDYSEKTIKAELDYLAGNLLCDKEVRLKIGAQVMCIVNLKSETGGGLDICNGSQGIVTSFCVETGYPIVRFNNGFEKLMQRHVWPSEKIPGIGVSQVPLILAWALTIHKSQGATLDVAEVDAGSEIFACGQTYVALSRVKSLEGLYLTSFDVKRIRIDKKVRDYYELLTAYQDSVIDILPGKEHTVPLVFAEEVQIAEPVRNGNENLFIDYQYVEAVPTILTKHI